MNYKSLLCEIKDDIGDDEKNMMSILMSTGRGMT